MRNPAFTEVENTDPKVHKKWLDKHGLSPDANGQFPLEFYEGKAAPVELDKLLDNIKENASRGYEAVMPNPFDDRTFVMICGGPSLENYLDDIRIKAENPDQYVVVCSNQTGRYLLQNGIVSHIQFIIDPTEKKKFDVAPGSTNPDTEYWINASCDPKVFAALEAQDIKPKIFLADFDVEGRAMKCMIDNMQDTPNYRGFMSIQGGTMAGLRAMNLADALGFRKMEYYGFDATVQMSEGAARPYAYDKKRGEAIIEIDCDRCGEKFPTTLVFQGQVNEFIKWRANMPWLDIKIFGGGLISHYNDHLFAEKKVRAPHRYTPEYIQLQKKLHEVGNYGVSGITHMPTIFHAISQLAKKNGSVSVLDYGSADGKTIAKVKEEFWLPPSVEFSWYDPAVDGFSRDPIPADFVICTDVLEHVEPECTWAVLDHLEYLTKKLIFLTVNLVPARKTLPDGRNAHINLREAEFWMKEIQTRFLISEAQLSKSGDEVLMVAQSLNAVRETLRRAA